jgi:hypothetical protein
LISTKRVFFFLHFVLGFLNLWLFYHYVHLEAENLLESSLAVRTFLEVLFLVICVVWGNAGWDSYKKLGSGPQQSALIRELAKSSAPLLVLLPFVSVIFELYLDSSLVNIRWALDRLSLSWHIFSLLIGIGLLVCFWSVSQSSMEKQANSNP